MLIEKDIQKALHLLSMKNPINIRYDGSDIEIRFVDDASKLSLSTSVYFGGNYIPSSVRRSALQPLPYSHPSIATYLTIDEQHYQIDLHYLGQAGPLSSDHFKDLVEEFGTIAEKWRLHLDENDKNDLIHVRVK